MLIFVLHNSLAFYRFIYIAKIRWSAVPAASKTFLIDWYHLSSYVKLNLVVLMFSFYLLNLVHAKPVKCMAN